MARKVENYIPVIKWDGLNTDKAVSFGSTLAVTGASTFTGVATFTGNPVFNGGQSIGPIVLSALVGATVVLTAAQSGGVFINRSTSASPSWTLPTAAAGLYYHFLVSNVTTGFTITGGTMFAKAAATGASVTGTTLTNTQGTAVIGDYLLLWCDGTSWRGLAQTGVFAAT